MVAMHTGRRVAATGFRSLRPAVALIALFLLGCMTQLAPPYDKAVVDALNSASEEVMTLLAAASDGTRPETFSAREEQYNAAIGKLDALAVLAGARPMPKNGAVEKINRLLDQRGAGPLKEDAATPPSVGAIKEISKALTRMRDTDRKQGVTATEAQAFKGVVVISFDQAITYENFLQR